MKYYIFFNDCGCGYCPENFGCEANSPEEALDRFFEANGIKDRDKKLYKANPNPDFDKEYDAWKNRGEEEDIVRARPIEL